VETLQIHGKIPDMAGTTKESVTEQVRGSKHGDNIVPEFFTHSSLFDMSFFFLFKVKYFSSWQ